MVEIQWSPVLFLLASVCVCSSVRLASRISPSEKERDGTHRSVEEVLIKSISPADTVPQTSLIKKGLLSCNMVQKRWLSRGISSGAMKKRTKETRKRLIDSQVPCPKGHLSATAMQDPWIASKKTKQMNRKCRLTDVKTHGVHCTVRAKNSLEQRRIDDFSRQDSDSLTVLRPEQRSETMGNMKAVLPKTQRGWNHPFNSIRDSNIKPFEQLKLNQSNYPRQYTASNYSYIRAPNSEHPVRSERARNNTDILDGELKSEGVAKSTNTSKSRTNKITDRGRSSSEYQLIPKIYAMNLLRNEKNNHKNFNNRDNWLAESAPNPIVVPGFQRKHTNAPVDNEEDTVSRRPYVIYAEDGKAPVGDEFIQNAPVVRSRDKNMPSNYDIGRVTPSGTPIQLPYAIPGGVNISILVPNPPAAPVHETPLLTPMTSTITYKSGKKKKDRKAKANNDDEILLCEPRSLKSTSKLDDVYGPNVFNDGDDNKVSGEKFINKPQFNHVIGEENFSVFNHKRNLSMNELGWRIHPPGVQTESAEKALADDDDDNDEIQMLYDEQSSSTKLQSDQARPTISFLWYTMTNVPVVKAHDASQTRQYRDPDQVMPVEFGGHERNKFRSFNDNSLNLKPRNGDFKIVADSQSYRSSATGEAIKGSEADPMNNFKPRMHHEGRLLDDQSRTTASRDQWDALDEALKSESCKKVDELWQARNRKREVDSENNQVNNDEQSYYRLSAGENSHGNPTNLIMSVFRAKPNKHGQRDYYDNIPENHHIREETQNRATSEFSAVDIPV